ncbi:hypothetical protein Salat_2611100 [Sesamum alatum]|uniref:Uncharacterized protein n=1 Tax=Sesamum alatum TaxID=300844 RepID=A0AAE2CAR4_9LAMI|nr:hypothetical protein Salat_2611100 [Sesamum alatum]
MGLEIESNKLSNYWIIAYFLCKIWESGEGFVVGEGADRVGLSRRRVGATWGAPSQAEATPQPGNALLRAGPAQLEAFTSSWIERDASPAPGTGRSDAQLEEMPQLGLLARADWAARRRASSWPGEPASPARSTISS